MRHAFLIIAHNEFRVLQNLIYSLDAQNCDVFVHIDSKVATMPVLTASYSGLYVLHERNDVRWGNVSQIKTELLLIQYAHRIAEEGGFKYDYYHIISGSHLPLASMSRFDDYFQIRPYAVFSPMYTDEYEIDQKVRMINLCTRRFNQSSIAQLFWKGAIKLQRFIGVKRFRKESFYKASNWCSLSDEAVRLIITEEESLVKKYRWSFCGDEFFIPTLLMNSERSTEIAWKSDYLYTNFKGTSNPQVLEDSDYDNLISSGCLWARKFSESFPGLISRIVGENTI